MDILLIISFSIIADLLFLKFVWKKLNPQTLFSMLVGNFTFILIYVIVGIYEASI